MRTRIGIAFLTGLLLLCVTSFEAFSQVDIYGANGSRVGRIDGNHIYDGSGSRLGRIDGNHIYDGSGNRLGRIDGNHIYDGSGSRVGRVTGSPVQVRTAALLSFFFFRLM